jgi:ribosomal protein S18 acetylase RimI-like enzyme
LGHISISFVEKPDRTRFLPFLEICFREEYAPLLGERTEGMIKNLRLSGIDDILPGDDQKMFEAVDDDRAVCGTIVMSERDMVTYIWGLYVLPTHQRQGIGKNLMRQVCLEAKPETELEIQVLNESEKAKSFYKGLGFQAYKSAKEEVFASIELDVNFMTCRASVVLAHVPLTPPLSVRAL